MFAPATFLTTFSVTDEASYSDPVILVGTGNAMTATATSAEGSDALISFGVQIQGYADGPWIDYLSGADWSSTSIAVMLFCSTQKPVDLAAEESSMFRIDVAGAYAVRFVATCDTEETAIITVGGGVSGGAK
jgi:hypothetical protein